MERNFVCNFFLMMKLNKFLRGIWFKEDDLSYGSWVIVNVIGGGIDR